MQESASAVLGKEKRDIKCSGENSVRWPWRNRGWDMQGLVGYFIMIKNMGLYPKNNERESGDWRDQVCIF